jgi:ribulose-phosphate 3-epimerase
MSSNILISPSILSCNFSKAGEEVKAVVEAGADLVHVDVMDGHFVDNLTIGPPVIQFLKPFSKVPLDVHLMIEKPEKWLDRYIQAGADILTFHVEACGDSVEALKHIRNQKIKSGITLRPQTPISKIEKLLKP